MFRIHSEEEHNFWISYTDLVTGFMIIFIVLTLILFYRQNEENPVDAKYKELTEAFEEEFKDVPEIEIADNATIRFVAQPGKELFVQNEYDLSPYFQKLLIQFIPGYIKRLENLYTASVDSVRIKEIRIEGHTDSKGRYITNLKFSSGRAQATQSFILKSHNFKSLSSGFQDFIRKNSIAVGYSESRLLDSYGNFIDQSKMPEDQNKSRRVEFRVLLELINNK